MAYPTFEQAKQLFLEADPFEEKLKDLNLYSKDLRLDTDPNICNIFVNTDALAYAEELNHIANMIGYYC